MRRTTGHPSPPHPRRPTLRKPRQPKLAVMSTIQSDAGDVLTVTFTRPLNGLEFLGVTKSVEIALLPSTTTLK